MITPDKASSIRAEDLLLTQETGPDTDSAARNRSDLPKIANNFVLFFPVRRDTDRPPCRFHHCPAQFLAPALGDALLDMFLPAVVHANSQSRVSNQLLCTFKAGNIANGGQYLHRHHHPKPGQLQQPHRLLAPPFSQTLASQLCIRFRFVLVHLRQHGQSLPDLDLLKRTETLPIPSCLVAQAVFRKDQVMAMNQALHPIPDHGACLDQPVALRDHPAQLTHMCGWYPYFGHYVCNQKPD